MIDIILGFIFSILLALFFIYCIIVILQKLSAKLRLWGLEVKRHMEEIKAKKKAVKDIRTDFKVLND